MSRFRKYLDKYKIKSFTIDGPCPYREYVPLSEMFPSWFPYEKYLAEGTIRKLYNMDGFIRMIEDLYGESDLQTKLKELLNMVNIDIEYTDTLGSVGGTVDILEQQPDGRLVYKVRILVDPMYLFICSRSITDFHTLALEIHAVLLHERVHMAQYERLPTQRQKASFIKNVLGKPLPVSDDTKKNIRRYLSTDRETMAFARSTAIRMVDRGYDKEQCLDFIRTGKVASISPEYREYMKHFKKDEDAIKRFQKHLYNYVNELEPDM